MLADDTMFRILLPYVAGRTEVIGTFAAVNTYRIIVLRAVDVVDL